MPDHNGWHWKEQDEWGGASAASITKLARNLKINPTAQVAREVIQNSWDAAQILRDEPGHHFSTVFRFVEFDVNASNLIRTAFSTSEMKEQFSSKFGLTPESASLVLGRAKVRALIVEDFGAHGLYGDPKLKNESIMYRALYKIGSTGKNSGDTVSGGSYGFGKSAFISASESNLVVAYSCFRPYKKDKVTRRLVGWTWHDEFSQNDADFEGRAMFGEFFAEDSGEELRSRPYTDSKADSLAELLGLSTRDATDINQLGTSLVLFDPVINPEDLRSAVEENWWPAIVDPSISLDIRIEDFDGSSVRPQPRSRPDLKSLIRAYEIATQKSDAPLGAQEKAVTIAKFEKFDAIGKIGLVAEYSEDGSSSRKFPVAVLTRGPRMVIGQVEHTFQSKSVAIYSIFATSADSLEVDKALRDSEPYTHDRWNAVASKESEKISASLAAKIQSTFISEVNAFSKQMSLEVPVTPKRLTGFSKIFGKFFGDSRGQPPEPQGETMPISIRFGSKQLKAVGPGMISLTQVFDVSRSMEDEKETVKLRVTPGVKILMDESVKGEAIKFQLTHQDSGKLEKSADFFELDVDLKTKKRFTLESDPYDHKWSADLQIKVEVVEQ
jgi:hypothetical protein